MVVGVLEGVWRSRRVEEVSMWLGRSLRWLKWPRAGIPLTETPSVPHGPPKSPLETPNPPRDPQIPTGLSQLPVDP